jgi:hypothetical protein
MVLAEKDYFALEEVAERWRAPMRDLAYMAENGLVRVSVRLFDVCLERGVYERDTVDGRHHRVAFEQAMFTGLQDLLPRDAFRVFVAGEAQVLQFDAPGDAYTALIPPTEALIVRPPELVVRREERDRVERSGLLKRPQETELPALEQRYDYREVRVGTLKFSLGRLQANVVKHLHQAAQSGEGWCAGKTVLAAAGSTSKRMQDIFKSQSRWRELIESDRYGRYRLRIKTR